MTVQRAAIALSSFVFVGLLTSPGKTVRAQLGPTTIVATDNRELRSWDATVDAMIRDGSLQLRRTDEDTLLSGRVHERLDQYYKGIRVYGGDVTRQTDHGLTVSIFGNLYPDIDIELDPALSNGAAAAVIKADSGVVLGPSKMPELLILPENGAYRLVYRARAFSAEGGVDYFVNAQTGAIVHRFDAVQASIGTGTGVLGDTKKMSTTVVTGGHEAFDELRPPAPLLTFDMKGNLQRTLDFLNGRVSLGESDIAFDSDNKWSDSAAVDAHAYTGYVYDYYFKRMNRKGLDGNNFRMLSLVHPVVRDQVLSQPPSVQGLFYFNAGYFGGGVMVYGEGAPSNVRLSGQSWNFLAGALDVTAHELTHGVTDFTSGLIYQGESGALNEAFSDMIGTAVEFFFQPPGTGAPLTAEYLIGEDVVTPGGLRSMANPGAFGDPDHYTRRYTGTADNGGVHFNSGIGNHFYYLAIEGGINRTSGMTVVGVGQANRDQIEKAVFRAFTQMLPAGATYAVARAATIQAATDLFGASSNAVRAIAQAWTAVGVN